MSYEALYNTHNVMKIVFVMSKSIAVWIRADNTSTVFVNLAVPTNVESSTLYSEFFIVFANDGKSLKTKLKFVIIFCGSAAVINRIPFFK